MRAIGLDVGDKRIGIASGDTGTGLALPAGYIQRARNHVDYIAVIKAAMDRDAEVIVVGMPFNMDGSKGKQAQAVDAFVDGLRARTPLTVITWDERLSTVDAERLTIAGGRRATKGDLDAASAAVILQAYLDAERSKR